MSTTRAVWIFLLVLTVIRLALLGATQLSPDEAYYWMWSQRPALSYFSKGPGRRFRHPVEHGDFWRQRVWSSLLESAARRRDEPASLLLCAAPFQFAGRLLDRGRAQRHADLQSRQSRPDDRSALDLFLGGGVLHLLAGARTHTGLFLVVAADRPARRPRISLQIYQRTRADFDSARAHSRPAPAPRISSAESLSAPAVFASLHDPADRLEFAPRLDHARASPVARQSRRSAGLSSARVAHFSRRTFRDLFAVAFPRVWPGRRSRAGDARNEISRCSILLWFGLPVFLLYAILSLQQSGRAKLGCPRFPQPRHSCGFLLAGTGGFAHGRAQLVKCRGRARSVHERGCSSV